MMPRQSRRHRHIEGEQMRISSYRLPVGALLATILVALSASPAAAATTVKGQGVYARFNWTSEAGALVVVDKIDGNGGRLTLSAAGLLASQEYFVIGRSVDCGGPATEATRVFKVRFVSDAQGYGWVGPKAMFLNANISSIMFRTEDATPFSCVNSRAFEVATGDVNGDGAAGIMGGTSNTLMALIERRPNGHARVSIVVDPNDPTGDIYAVSLANRACGHAPTKTLKIQLDGAGYSVHDIHINQGNVNALRSVRLRNVSQGVNMGCAPLSVLIALLLP